MKQHLLAVLFACGALLLFWALLFPKPRPASERAARPLSAETAPAGYAGMSRWLEKSGVRVASLRRRFDELDAAQLDLPPTGNLLVITLPEKTALRAREFAAVDSWVRAGNALLVVAALDDTPAWDRDSASNMPEQLNALTRLEFNVVPERSDVSESLATALKPPEPVLSVNASHPVNERVYALVTKAERPASQWLLQSTGSDPVLVLARRADTNRPAIWLWPRGAGTVVVSAWASPFANGQLGKADNARWVAQLVGWTLGPGGVVVFDDMHQGASVYYDPEQFFSDPRLKHVLLWLVGLWFAWVFGVRVLRAAPAARPPLDDTAMLRVTGGFLAHVLRPADAARELFRYFFNRLRRRLSLPETGEPLWEWLASQARVEEAALQHLRTQYARAAAGQRVNLITLRNQLHDLTGRLA
jgi:hypothetical protein